MNVLAYWSVLWRQRWLVLIGVVLAFVLSVLALVRVTPEGAGLPSVELRSPRVYSAESTLFVTQSGFPWGRSALDEYLRPKGGGPSAQPVPRFAEAGRMEYLTLLYSELANTDVVRKLIDPTGKEELRYAVVPVRTDGGGALPLLRVVAFSASGEEAVDVSRRVIKAVQEYVLSNQVASEVPKENRVQIEVAAAADEAKIFEGIRLTPSMMLFILGLTVTIIAAFMRHNIALARRPASSQESPGSATPATPIVVPPSRELSQRARRSGSIEW